MLEQASALVISNDTKSIISLALLVEQLAHLKSVETKLTEEGTQKIRDGIAQIIKRPSKYVGYNLHDLVRLVPMNRKTEVYMEVNGMSVKLNPNWLRTDLIETKRKLVAYAAQCANVLDTTIPFLKSEVEPT